MNEKFPPFRLPRPEIAGRKPEGPRFVPLTPDVIARRQEIARLLGAKIEALSQGLRHLTDEQRKAMFVKLEHEGTIELAGTGLKPITRSDRLTLAIPRQDNLDPLAKKVETFGTGNLKRGQPEHGKLVTRLTDIKPGVPTDRLSEELFRDFKNLIRRRFVIFEIEIISLEIGRHKQRAEIQETIEALTTVLTADEYGSLFEHEEIKGTCRAVLRCSGKLFKHLVEDPEWQTRISWFEARPEFETFHTTYQEFDVEKLGSFVSPRDAAPVVCIVDSGVTAGNPFLRPVVREDLFRSFLKSEPDNPYDQNGHGSGVASLAAYYALNLADGATNEGKVWIASARVLDKDNNGEMRLFSAVLGEVVETFVPLGVRIFNLSVGIKNRLWNAEGKRTVARTSWIARKIDELIRKHDVVFIVGTGNLFNDSIEVWNREGKAYSAYFVEEEARMLDPGQAALAITVGATARSTLAVVPKAATAVAEQFQPSPFTRTGPGVRREIKPELVDYGGNLLQNPGGDVVRSNLGTDVIMASHMATPAIAHKRGTSFAAPRVTHKLALILNDLQALGLASIPEHLLRAFLVNSAQYSGLGDEFDTFVQSLDLVQAKHWLNVLGHGLPDPIRATYCDDHSALLYFHGEIGPDKVAFFDVPVPVSLAEAERGVKRLTVTVVSSPRVQRWGLEEYLGTTMRWRLFRGDVDRNQVVEAMSAEEEESEETELPERPKEVRCKLGINHRSRGTVQHDIAEWSAHKHEYSSNHYTLAVAAYHKWGTGSLPYSVIVRIEDTTRTAQVYAEVSNILTQIEIQSRSLI